MESSPVHEVLKSVDRVVKGGEDYLEWCADLLRSRLASLTEYYCQGIVVPQLGERAGEPLTFTVFSLEHANCISPSTVNRMTGELWQTAAASGRRLAMECEHDEPHLSYIFAAMAHGFDRPIGCLGVIVRASDANVAETELDYALNLLCVVVRAEKACRAVDRLARPIWAEATTTARTAEEVAASCRRALSCSCVVVWQMDRDGARLKTLAVDGNASRQLKVDMRVGEGVAGTCAQDSAAIVVDDLEDPEELARLGVRHVEHPAVVKEYGWRSAIFVPLDAGDKIAGVISAYGPRPKGFSALDKTIAVAFARRLDAGYVHAARIEYLSELEKRLSIEAPAMEAGILAMERVHDVDNNLILAQGQLSIITSHFRHQEDSPIGAAARVASDHVDLAHKEIKALVSRSRMDRIVLSRFDLPGLIREAVGRMTAEAQDHKVRIRTKLPPKLDVRLDREGILRVILNLLGNSIFWLATDTKGGERKILVSAEQFRGTVVIRVEDNGPGIAPYQKDHVFDYFFTTKGERGMGFGLPIAKRFVERLGGSITVESKWGYNTEFVITLPLNAAE